MKNDYLVFRQLCYKNGYGLWIGEYDLTTRKFKIAKPLKLEFVDSDEGWSLPEPTIEILGPNAKEAVEKLAEDMQLSGVKINLPPNADGARKDHIADLRSIISEIIDVTK